jgi:hypothetical protein
MTNSYIDPQEQQLLRVILLGVPWCKGKFLIILCYISKSYYTTMTRRSCCSCGSMYELDVEKISLPVILCRNIGSGSGLCPDIFNLSIDYLRISKAHSRYVDDILEILNCCSLTNQILTLYSCTKSQVEISSRHLIRTSIHKMIRNLPLHQGTPRRMTRRSCCSCGSMYELDVEKISLPVILCRNIGFLRVILLGVPWCKGKFLIILCYISKSYYTTSL